MGNWSDVRSIVSLQWSKLVTNLFQGILSALIVSTTTLCPASLPLAVCLLNSIKPKHKLIDQRREVPSPPCTIPAS